eukprot:m.179416 g.179416  ORF g.179416 m.179416 type:complete len:183 (+) comp25389_c0_seq3:207-755(+)
MLCRCCCYFGCLFVVFGFCSACWLLRHLLFLLLSLLFFVVTLFCVFCFCFWLLSRTQRRKMFNDNCKRLLFYSLALFSLSAAVRWQAPECIKFQKYSSKSDVWSFGVLLFELFSWGSRPWQGLSSAQVVLKVMAGERLAQPEMASEELYDVMVRTWAFNSGERPSFSQLEQMLEDVEPESAV